MHKQAETVELFLPVCVERPGTGFVLDLNISIGGELSIVRLPILDSLEMDAEVRWQLLYQNPTIVQIHAAAASILF